MLVDWHTCRMGLINARSGSKVSFVMLSWDCSLLNDRQDSLAKCHPSGPCSHADSDLFTPTWSLVNSTQDWYTSATLSPLFYYEHVLLIIQINKMSTKLVYIHMYLKLCHEVFVSTNICRQYQLFHQWNHLLSIIIKFYFECTLIILQHTMYTKRNQLFGNSDHSSGH